jgi:hypothetical protein
MKLFQRLLVAPAALGLLAPTVANANELNLNAITGYSQEKLDLDSNSFKSHPVKNSLLLSGGEGLVETSEESSLEGFSTTTTASFGSTFYVGAVSESDAEAVTFSYDFGMDLSTSFTGEDSLDVAIIGGNADGDTVPVDLYMDGDGTGDVLTLDGISYTFPLGSATVIVGDGVGVDDMNTGACAYSAFTDLLGDCGTSSVGGSADSAIAIGYDFGNGFTIAGGVGGGDSTDGFFTEEDASTVGLEAAYTADTYGLSVAYTDDEDLEYISFQGMLAPEGFPSISVGFETEEDADAASYFAGLTFDEVGPGSVSLGYSEVLTGTDSQYELSYSYPLNDGVTITPGIFVADTAGDDETGVVVTTSFSF